MYEHLVETIDPNDFKTVIVKRFMYKDKVICRLCGEEISKPEIDKGCVAYVKKKQKDGSYFIDQVEHRRCTDDYWEKWRNRQAEIAKQIEIRRNHKDGTATLFDFM